MNPYEAVSVVFGVISVWLTARENVWCWPTGLVNVGLAIVVFAQARLYADMGLQVVYVAACLYGWWAWLHGGQDHGELKVSRVPLWLGAGLAAAGILFAAGLGKLLQEYTNAALPFLDSTLTSFSLVAQWMLTRKWIENWVVWLAVDVVYVGMFVFKGLYLMAGLYGVFLGLAVMGLHAWGRSLRKQREETVPR
jgi:nicotinamide mononucleotide transporter